VTGRACTFGRKSRVELDRRYLIERAGDGVDRLADERARLDKHAARSLQS
jgi:hypothetical protein